MAAPTPHSLVDSLEASAAAHGPRDAFLTKKNERWVATSYAAFARAVDELRGGLATLGIGPGDRVGIIANNRVEWAAVAYATYGLGAALVPMYESQLPREWTFIARDAGLRALFVATAEIHARLAAVPTPIPTLAARDPAVERRLPRADVRIVARHRRGEAARGAAPARRRCGVAALHVGHDRRSQGRGADPRQHSVQRAWPCWT